MRDLGDCKTEHELWNGLVKRSSDLLELLELAADEDETVLEQLGDELEELTREFERHEFKLRMNGPYDRRPALVAVKSGAGGVDAQDWTAMLVRMYLRWAESNKYDCQVLDHTPGDEAGTKSTTLRFAGHYAYGFLRGEKGVHRLVRLSPFDANHRRHTSFALVEVLPEPEARDQVRAQADDLKYDFFRAGGHGGQNVQKNATAVRVKHIPSGITVSVQNERSQLQNKDLALKILNARLINLDMERQLMERDKIKGEHRSAEFGNQARSYVMHPYQMVKDHRTDHQEADVNKILDGGIDEFIRRSLMKGIRIKQDDAE